MDHICHSHCFVASGNVQWLHYWRIHSHPAGHRHRRAAASGYSGTKAIVAIGTLAGGDEALGKEVAGIFRNHFAGGRKEHITVVRVVNLSRYMEELKRIGLVCYGLDEKVERSINEIDLTSLICLVFGREDGLRRLTRERCDMMVRIPTSSDFPSLNLANAFAVHHMRSAGKRATCDKQVSSTSGKAATDKGFSCPRTCFP